jgi:hypothetical protein
MTTRLRHARGPLFALMGLALSASLAFASEPAGSVAGLGQATAHSGKAVPVRAQTDGLGADEDSGTESDSDTDPGTETDTSTETPDVAGDNCVTDPATLTPEQLAAATHGSIVCWAANQPTPDGYANHGAWVKHWAQMKFDANGVAIPKAQHGKSANHL